ncbi:hypothetical protein QZH41_004466 [Actinostola sp. cb2023]|nr:hypothetical protein QZH41_004466 [Actinostola sp. cb2023]
MAEQRLKRIQIRNIVEEKSLKEKLRMYARQQSYVDKELQHILQAKECLLQSLRNVTLGQNVPKSARSRCMKKVDDPQPEQGSKRRKSFSDAPLSDEARGNSIHRRSIVQSHLKKIRVRDTKIPVLPGNTKSVASVATIPGNVPKISAVHALPGARQCTTTTGIEPTNRDQHESKSCFRMNRTRMDSRVRFSFPGRESEKVDCDDEENNDKVSPRFSSRNKYHFKSHCDLIEEIKIRSYGYITPNTTSGRLFCIFYALFGIPLAALLLQATGGAIFAVLRQLIVRIERKLKGNDAEGVKNAELKSLIGSLILLTIVILLFSSAFGYKNGTFVEGVYSWFITLSTIGYGDIVPGLHSNNLLMVWLRVIFMFLGLSITASVLNSLASWISKRDLKVCRCCCAGMTNKIVKARWTRESYSLEMEEKGREGKYRNNSNTVEQASGKQDGDTKY